MIYILYSSDYEVYLGGNYIPEEEILIETTNKLLKACGDIDIPLTIFCDVACIWRYRELGYNELPDAIENQLRLAVAHTHDVQAHIHPHWLTADITKDGDITNYKYKLTNYSLGNYEYDTSCYEFSYELLSRAKEYLTNLLRPIDNNYDCIAYRAGGYAIQEKASEILAALCDAGYLIDSSIVPGLVLSTNVQQLNFTHLTKKANYWFKPERGIRESDEGCIFEIPVAAGKIPIFDHIFGLLKRRIKNHKNRQEILLRGFPINISKSTLSLNKIAFALKYLCNSWMMLELIPDVDTLIKLTTIYISENYKSGDIYFSFSCHPKALEEKRILCLKEYHRRLKNIYGDELQSISFRDAAKRIRTYPQN